MITESQIFASSLYTSQNIGTLRDELSVPDSTKEFDLFFSAVYTSDCVTGLYECMISAKANRELISRTSEY